MALPALRAQVTRVGFVTTLGRDTIANSIFAPHGTVSHSVADMDPMAWPGMRRAR